MYLRPCFVTEPCGGEAYSVRFSPDDSLLAVSSAAGPVHVYNVATSQEAFRLNRSGSHPTKQVTWRPESVEAPLRVRSVLVAVSTDGQLRQWHVASNRLLKEWSPTSNDDSADQLFCVDYAPDGSQIVAGGIRELWIFDDETKKQVVTLSGGDTMTTTGHTNRVMAAKWCTSPGDSDIVISGGWDKSVQFWDIRVGHAVRSIYGPYICGDALDVSVDGRTLLTGSWRSEDSLELWDLRTCCRLEALPWRSANASPEPACFLYSACLSRSSDFVCAGGSCRAQSAGSGEGKVLKLGSVTASPTCGAEGSRGCECLATLVRISCLSTHFGSDASGLVALGGGDGRVRVLRMTS
eukprot:TRINITY_DN19883_c0_g1_i1.p1 TRINITY_DN19883_c0_g1~~TRINITY_DN19883_c0_g1_i1.p1  ORF type:complete len:351 (+),score=47.34 TRINITY_DN19883_c0_g1_i1:136-1188(+)